MYFRDRESSACACHVTGFCLWKPENLWEEEIPNKAKAMVKEFILKYRKELEEMRETGKYVKLPPLV